MPVIGRPRCADHGGSETGQHFGKLVVVEHAVFEAEIAGLGPHPLHHCAARFEFRLAEAEMHAARPLVPDEIPVRSDSSAASAGH